MSLPAANRDPAKHGCPADLDLGRDTAGHLAFGHGIHQCIGQNLAASNSAPVCAPCCRPSPTCGRPPRPRRCRCAPAVPSSA